MLCMLVFACHRTSVPGGRASPVAEAFAPSSSTPHYTSKSSRPRQVTVVAAGRDDEANGPLRWLPTPWKKSQKDKQETAISQTVDKLLDGAPLPVRPLLFCCRFVPSVLLPLPPLQFSALLALCISRPPTAPPAILKKCSAR